MAAARDAAPDLPRGYLLDRIPDDWQAQARELGAVAIHTNHKHLTRELAQAVKAAGYGLFCYTVNDPVRGREILSWGVDGFCTDRIDLIGPTFSRSLCLPPARTQRCTDVARVYGRLSVPVNTSLNCTMPLLVSSKVGSLPGTRELERTIE